MAQMGTLRQRPILGKRARGLQRGWKRVEFSTHDQARSKAYRWGEDGIAGICDRYQLLVFALAFWNGRDPILKERMFGLTSNEGNHGEDVKEYWFHLDNTPTHSYMRMLYKYPQREYPYRQLIEENRRRSREPEFELLDTGIFDDDRYFDIFIEYAKKSPEDICIRIEAFNRGPDAAELHLLPHLWFRNTWSWTDPRSSEPIIKPETVGKNMSCWWQMIPPPSRWRIFNCNTLLADDIYMRRWRRVAVYGQRDQCLASLRSICAQPLSLRERRISSLRRERRAVREPGAIWHQGLRSLSVGKSLPGVRLSFACA